MNKTIIERGLEVFYFTCVQIYVATCPLCKCRFEYTEEDIAIKEKIYTAPHSYIHPFDIIKLVMCPCCQKEFEHKQKGA